MRISRKNWEMSHQKYVDLGEAIKEKDFDTFKDIMLNRDCGYCYEDVEEGTGNCENCSFDEYNGNGSGECCASWQELNEMAYEDEVMDWDKAKKNQEAILSIIMSDKEDIYDEKRKRKLVVDKAIKL